jgi:uncharacterized protein (DUF433 family)
MRFFAIQLRSRHGVPMHDQLDNLAAGHSVPEIVQLYPALRESHVAAAISYTAGLAGERVVTTAA